jgi:hypothetical protein
MRPQGISFGRRPAARGVGLWTIPAISVALLLMVPMAGAVGTLAFVKHTAPFHGTVHLATLIVSNGCGGAAAFVVAPAFNLTSGVGVSFGKSSATACGPMGFSNYGATEGTTGFDSTPFVQTTPAVHNWSIRFNFSFYFNVSATPQNPAGGPFAWASAEFFGIGLLWDLTNSSKRASCSFEIAGLTTNGSATGTWSGQYTGPFGCATFKGSNITAVGHQYTVEFFAEVFEWAYAPGGTSTHAFARLNMATGGHHFKPQYWATS